MSGGTLVDRQGGGGGVYTTHTYLCSTWRSVRSDEVRILH